MAKTVEFFFDFGSPTSFVAHRRLPAITAAAGAELRYRPMLLGGVMKATGNSPPFAVPAKGAYTGRDLARYAKKHAIPLAMNPHFPINTLSLMRAAASLEGSGTFAAFVEAMFNAMWLKPRNMGDAGEVVAALNEAGLDGAGIVAGAESQEAKDRLKATTEEAVSRGVFGAPTFFVGDEMFFGQDRIDWIADILGGPGAVSFLEIGSNDTAATEAFFTRVFGWGFDSWGKGGMFKAAPTPTGMHGDDASGQIYVFYRSADLDADTARAVAAGATIERPAEAETGFGRFVGLVAPGGVRFGFHQP